MKFMAERDLAVCGLACVLCSDADCPGCKARGLDGGCDCSIYHCAMSKGLDGCYQCDEFPCGEEMLKGVRNRAFNYYAREHGKLALLDRLRDNYENGIEYHRPGGLKGDYDTLLTENEILDLIRFGKRNPYLECPAFETEHFIVRLIREEDALELMDCYSDKLARKFFNSDGCTSDFFYDTIDEMRECVAMWVASYARRDFVRFAIVEKASRRAIGTIEMFGFVGRYKTERGILRLDIMFAYEEAAYLQELFSLCVREFFKLFAVQKIVTKAIPEAVHRVAALESLGFAAHDLPGREHYWIK